MAHVRLEQCRVQTEEQEDSDDDDDNYHDNHSAGGVRGGGGRGAAAAAAAAAASNAAAQQLGGNTADAVRRWATAHRHLSWQALQDQFAAAVRQVHVVERQRQKARVRVGGALAWWA